MSATTTEAKYLLTQRGVSKELGAFVVAARFSRDGQTVAFALGDGTVRRGRRTDLSTWASAEVHDGPIRDAPPDAVGDGFVPGADNGAVKRIAADGTVSA